MTIDEAISEFKERAEDSKKISGLGMKSYIPKEKEEKQLAEWLEELKQLRIEKEKKCDECTYYITVQEAFVNGNNWMVTAWQPLPKPYNQVKERIK